MIVADTSVWIDHLNNRQTCPWVRTFRDPNIANLLLVGDVIMTEVLQGARNDAHAARLEATLKVFPIVRMLGADLSVQAARQYRHMRVSGFIVSKLADLLIGTYCLAHGHELLHNDAHYDAMEQLCGLRVHR